MLLLHVKFYALIILLFLISCSDNRIVNNLLLYNGVSEITKQGDNRLAFLANLKEYNNIMALCYIDEMGELLKVYPIDKYSNIDVSLQYIKLINHNGLLNLIYENRGVDILVESFNELSLYKTIHLKRDEKSYGSLIKFGQSGHSEFIKSSVFYNSSTHKSYIYNYFLLSDSLELLERGSFDLGQFYPRGMLLLNGSIFYYIDDRQLLFKSLNGGNAISIYNFESDIIQLKQYKESVLVLLSDSIYIVTDDGELSKGFNLLQKGSNYIASSILESEDEFIVVQLKSANNTIYKTFSLFGSQVDEYRIDDISVGDSYVMGSIRGKKIFYSTQSNLYLKVF